MSALGQEQTLGSNGEQKLGEYDFLGLFLATLEERLIGDFL